MLILVCLLSLRFAFTVKATAGFMNVTACEEYPRVNDDLESQGIYTGYRVPDHLLVFNISEKSILANANHADCEETKPVWKTMTLRDDCTTSKKKLAPNLMELLENMGDTCFTGPSQGSHDIHSYRGRPFMAVWTFLVPARQCFQLKASVRIQEGQSDYYEDRITILDRGLSLPVVIKPGVFHYDIPIQNITTTISVVYFHTSLSRSVYWKMAPSLQSSDCLC